MSFDTQNADSFFSTSILGITEFAFQTGNLFLLIRGVITGATNRDIARLPEILQPFCQSAVTHTEILSTATNTKLFVIEIILDCVQFKLFVMLLCYNEILLQYDTSIVSYIVYLEFSHFDLHYLYTTPINSQGIQCGTIHLRYNWRARF